MCVAADDGGSQSINPIVSASVERSISSKNVIYLYRTGFQTPPDGFSKDVLLLEIWVTKDEASLSREWRMGTTTCIDSNPSL